MILSRPFLIHVKILVKTDVNVCTIHTHIIPYMSFILYLGKFETISFQLYVQDGSHADVVRAPGKPHKESHVV